MARSFYKYHGTGNDFILVDSRQSPAGLSTADIARLCHRRFGIGADGLMELRLHPDFDFEMVYYNSDGRPGSMCGNGGRCITQFAHDLGIRREAYHFLASDGPHAATITPEGWVRLQMKDVAGLQPLESAFFADTGSPHYVTMVQQVQAMDVVPAGRAIRYSDSFREQGVNVNFVEALAADTLFVRTYERGVEDETYSCGTGVTAAALVYARNQPHLRQVHIQTLGGKLAVSFQPNDDGRFTDVWLAGPAEFVFAGTLPA